jgi:hypothetical protein
MEKKYQVFVSSTYIDLVDERKEVIQALLELDCIPVGMEMFPAADDDQWSLIKRLIDDCDYYILIVGGRYGSVSDSGISFTQMEYDYAISKGVPVIAFLHQNPESIAVSKSEKDPNSIKKFEGFKEKVKKKLCKSWETPTDLGSKVSRSLVRLIKDKPMPGWVKASFVTSEDTAKEILDLKKQIENLNKQINENTEKAPFGSEKFSQGAEVVYLTYQLNTNNKKDGLDFFNEGKDVLTSQQTVAVSWNEIFKEIAPLMIDETSDYYLRDKIVDLLGSKNAKAEADILKRNKQDNIQGRYLNDNSFQQVKVQLRALGLIAKSDKKRSIKDNDTYWRLTDYGDFQMTKLIAIEKKI